MHSRGRLTVESFYVSLPKKASIIHHVLNIKTKWRLERPENHVGYSYINKLHDLETFKQKTVGVQRQYILQFPTLSNTESRKLTHFSFQRLRYNSLVLENTERILREGKMKLKSAGFAFNHVQKSGPVPNIKCRPFRSCRSCSKQPNNINPKCPKLEAKESMYSDQYYGVFFGLTLYLLRLEQERLAREQKRPEFFNLKGLIPEIRTMVSSPLAKFSPPNS